MSAPGGEGGNLGMQLWVSVLPTIQGIQERFRAAGTVAGGAMGEAATEALAKHISTGGGGAEAAGTAYASKFTTSFKGSMATLLTGDMFAAVQQKAEEASATMQLAGRQHAERFLAGFGDSVRAGGSSGAITMQSAFDQMLSGLPKTFSQSGQTAHRAFMDELTTKAPIPTSEELAFTRALPGLTSIFGNAGKMSAEAFGKESSDGFGHVAEKIMEEFLPAKWQGAIQSLTGVGHDMGKMHTDAIAEESAKLGGKMVPTMENVGANVAGKLAESGKLAGNLMSAGIVGAVVIGAELALHDIQNLINLANKEIETFWNVGKEAANTLMESLESTLAGHGPDVMGAINVVEEGFKGLGELPFNVLNTEIDNTVGRIPIIGEAIKMPLEVAEQAFSAFFTVFDEGKQLAGAYISTLTEVGDTWTELKRTIVGQTLLPNEDIGSGLERYIDAVREISGSGALVWFEDVAKVIGELDQRLSGLDNGVGLTKQQLTELAKTVAEGNEVLGGIKINVDNLTAAFNDFNVPAEATTGHLNTLINISRLTGANINELTTDIDAVAPSLQALGYGLDDSAFMMGKLNQELGKPAMNRLAFGIGQIEDKIHDMGIDDVQKGWTDAIQMTQQYIAAGEHAEAVDFLKSFVGSSRTAETLVDGISKGIVDTPEKMRAMMNGVGPLLHQPLDAVLEATKTLEDSFHQLGNQAMAALEPLGVGVMQSLEGATGHISAWLEKNEGTVIEYAANVGHWILSAITDVAGFVGAVFTDAAPAVDAFVKFVAWSLRAIDVTMQSMLAPLAMLPSWLGGDAFKSMQDSLKDATGPLNAIMNAPIGDWMKNAGAGMDALAAGADALQKPLTDLQTKAETTAAFQSAFTQQFRGAGQEAPEMQWAIDPDTEKGIKLLGDKATWKQIQDEMDKLGIHLDINQQTGEIEKFTTKTKAEADDLRQYFLDKFGGSKSWFGDAPLLGKLNIVAGPDTPLTPQQVMDGVGIPGELQGPDGVHIKTTIDPPATRPPGTGSNPPLVGGGGSFDVTPHDTTVPSGPPPEQQVTPGVTVHGSSYMLVPGQIGIQPAAFNKTISQVQDSAGIPYGMKTSTGVQIPTGLDVRIPFVESTKESTMDAAGIPKDYQGDVKGASPGVSIATGLDVLDNPDRKSIGEMMDAVGIPASFQGTDGITMPVAFNMQGGTAGLGFTGVPGGGGAPVGPITGGASGVAQAIFAAAQSRGFSPEQTQAVLATALQESGLNQGASGGGGAWQGIFQQDSGYPNRGTAEGNIQGFFDRLGPPTGDIWGQIFALQQGTPYSSPGARRGYMNEIQSQLGPAQSLYQQLSAGGGTIPGGSFGTPVSDGSYAGIGATDNSSTALPRYGGIPNAPSGQGQDVLAFMKSVMDSFNASTGSHLSVTADYPGGPHGHPDDGADHSVRRALDIAGTQQEMDAFARMWASNPSLLAATRQLIHNDPNDTSVGTNYNIIGGHTTSGYDTYAQWMSGHINHDHLAMQYIPGQPANGGGATNVVPADYTSAGSGSDVIMVDNKTKLGPPGAPGVPVVPAPTAPGDTYASGPPDPLWPKATPGAPGAISTPFGDFNFSWDMSDDDQKLLSPEMKQKLDTWLNKYGQSLKQAGDDQDAINKANDDLQKKLAAKKEADDAWQRILDAAIAAGIDTNSQTFLNEPKYKQAKDKADAADAAAAAAQKGVDSATDRQSQNAINAKIQAEGPAPWQKAGAKATPGDPNAEALGKGLVKGIFQELGFPDVFGKPITEWGIWKLAMGGAGVGLGMLQNMTQLGPGNPIPGAYGGGAGATPAGTGSPLGGLMSGIFPGVSQLFNPTGTGTAPPLGPAPGPEAMPSSLFAQGSSAPAPAVQPAGASGGGLTVYQNNSGIMAPPDVHQTVQAAAHSTSATAVSGGAPLYHL